MEDAAVEGKKPFYKNPYFVAAVISMIVLPALRPFLRHIPKPPPVQFTLPNDFQFVNQSNAPFNADSLRGHVSVAGFIFTRCTSFCPMITQRMKELRQKFDNARAPIQMVSFTVDPQYDVPSVLTEYGSKFSIDFKNWNFVTGAPEAIRKFLESDFHVPVDREKGTGSLVAIAHAQKLTIIDRHLGVRGFYGIDDLGIDEIFNRTLHVYDQEKEK